MLHLLVVLFCDFGGDLGRKFDFQRSITTRASSEDNFFAGFVGLPIPTYRHPF